MTEEQFKDLMEEDKCPHRPNLWDKFLYYVHIVYNHGIIRIGELEIPMPVVLAGQIQQTLCLTRDWIDYEVACPKCEVFRCTQLGILFNAQDDED